MGQWVDADALYLRDFSTWEQMDAGELRRLAAILLACYDAFSASVRLIEILRRAGALGRAEQAALLGAMREV